MNRRHSDPGVPQRPRDVPRLLLQGISQHELFSHVPPALVADLASHMNTMRMRRGDTVVSEGESGATLFFVVSGSLHVRVRAVDDAPIATVGRGAFVGEVGAFYGLPRTATVSVASENATIAALPRKEALAVLAAHPRIFADVLSVAQQRYYKAMHRGVSNRSVHAHADVLLRASPVSNAVCPLSDRISPFPETSTLQDAAIAGHEEAVARRVFPRLFRHMGDGALRRLCAMGRMCAPMPQIVAFAREPVVVLVLEGALALRLTCEEAPCRVFPAGSVASIARAHPITSFLAAEPSALVLKVPVAAYERLEADAYALDRGQVPEFRVRAILADAGEPDCTPARTVESAGNCSADTVRTVDRVSPAPSVDSLALRVRGPELPMPQNIYAADATANPLLCKRTHAHVPLYVTDDGEGSAMCPPTYRALFPADDTLRPAPGVGATLTRDALLAAVEQSLTTGAALRCVDMQDCVRLDEDAFLALLARLGRRGGSVTALRLGGCPGVTDAVIAAVCSQMPFLEHVEVSHCRNVTASGLAPLSALTDTLSTLGLRRLAAVTDAAAASLVESIGGGPEPGKSGAEDAGGAPKRVFSRLTALDLSDCAFLTTRGLGVLLARMPRLRTLSVAMCDGLDERVWRALSRLPAPQRLTMLDVSHCGRVLADRPLCAAVSAVPGLQRLEIHGARRLTPSAELGRVPRVLGCSIAERVSPVLHAVSVAP